MRLYFLCSMHTGQPISFFSMDSDKLVLQLWLGDDVHLDCVKQLSGDEVFRDLIGDLGSQRGVELAEEYAFDAAAAAHGNSQAQARRSSFLAQGRPHLL